MFTPTGRSESVARSEAEYSREAIPTVGHIDNDNDNDIRVNRLIETLTGPLYKVMPRLPCDPVPLDTIEDSTWYYMVFKPFNDRYDPAYNGLDYVRKFVTSNKKTNAYVITRERNAAKVHYNVLINVNNSVDMTKYDNHPTQKYMISSVMVGNTIDDRKRVYVYITKEYYKDCIPWELHCDYSYKRGIAK